MRPSRGLIRFPTSRINLDISAGFCGFDPRPPSPTQLAPSGFILSTASRLYRVLPSLSPPPVRRPRVPSLGLPSLFATSTRRIVSGRLPDLPPSVLGVSHTLDGLIRPWSCGFISPHSHVQGSLFRGYSLRRSLVASRQLVALTSLSAVRYWQLPTSSAFHRPALRALIRAGVRCPYIGG